jgi:hypothetical protein
MRHPVIMLIVILSLIAAEIKAAEIADSGEQNLLLFYSNDVMGETEPCG